LSVLLLSTIHVVQLENHKYITMSKTYSAQKSLILETHLSEENRHHLVTFQQEVIHLVCISGFEVEAYLLKAS
jgi:hypothetical protein